MPDELTAVRTPDAFPARVVARLERTTVAVKDGQVAGFVTVTADEVEQVFVDGGHRGGGVATLLLDEAERQVATAGHVEAFLVVAVGNARARRFYERQGWADAGPVDYPAETAGDSTMTVVVRRYVKRVHR
ncbi:GNAT family N-acetyltransferase [Actinoplanes couchii]|uniref:GNAT family N-acetyltransferase n=1 Tax=Actinoplanes couchii TaxID=403638 RepID=A0ABQ3XFE7_9ACTN|nr:GNAT family N-acetyltransferase [Actinoplanes couchii]